MGRHTCSNGTDIKVLVLHLERGVLQYSVLLLGCMYVSCNVNASTEPR